MDLIKPFDMLVIESPYEYDSLYPKKKNQLLELADICRKNRIPVRVPEGSAYYEESPQDHRVKGYFRGCNYSAALSAEEIVSLDQGHKPRILLTGGLFILSEVGWAELHEEDISTLQSYFPLPQAFTACGCVASRVEAIYFALNERRAADIYIDGRTVAGDALVRSDSLYKVFASERISSKEHVRVIRLPRTELIQN